MLGMPSALLCAAWLAGALVPGLPWLRSSSTAAEAPAKTAEVSHAADAPDRVVLLDASDAAYAALAIPRSYKTAAAAPLRLLVFHGGAVVRDHGVADRREERESGPAGRSLVEESGTAERAFVAADASRAIVCMTRYVSKVDMNPDSDAATSDPVTGTTTLTSVDPEHPDGEWRLTLENGRWLRDLIVLPKKMGVVVMSFLPRNGPADVRLLDGTGREMVRVSDASGDALRIEATADGRFAAADVAFHDTASFSERGVIVFDVAHGSQWTYGWRYGSDDEPTAWSLRDGGILTVSLPRGERRYDSTGRRQ